VKKFRDLIAKLPKKRQEAIKRGTLALLASVPLLEGQEYCCTSTCWVSVRRPGLCDFCAEPMFRVCWVKEGKLQCSPPRNYDTCTWVAMLRSGVGYTTWVEPAEGPFS
jgi:hypothetical protein